MVMLIWDLKESEPSRMTPRLFTWGEGETMELSNEREKLSALSRVDLVPTKRISVLLLLSLRKFEVNQVCSSERQSVRDEGGRMELGLVER